MFSPASSGSCSSLIMGLVDIPLGSAAFQREAYWAINRRGSRALRAGSFAGVRNSPVKGFWHIGPSFGGVSYVSLTSPVPRGQWVSGEPSSDYGADLGSCLPATTTSRWSQRHQGTGSSNITEPSVITSPSHMGCGTDADYHSGSGNPLDSPWHVCVLRTAPVLFSSQSGSGNPLDSPWHVCVL